MVDITRKLIREDWKHDDKIFIETQYALKFEEKFFVGEIKLNVFNSANYIVNGRCKYLSLRFFKEIY